MRKNLESMAKGFKKHSEEEGSEWISILQRSVWLQLKKHTLQGAEVLSEKTSWEVTSTNPGHGQNFGFSYKCHGWR